jgi:hypothetical protein
MLCTVLHHGVPIGTVELGERELVAGTLAPTEAYSAIRSTIQAGSEALLQLGFFGAAMQSPLGRPAGLAQAAALTFELVDRNGHDIPATFVNLIEAPGDARVVVLARLSHAPASVTAERSARRGAAPEASRPDA